MRNNLRRNPVLALSVVAFLLVIRVLYPAPPAVIFLGLVLGSLTALISAGLVLVYRANRVVNFAQGSLGGVAAVLAASLIVGPKWPYLPAVLLGLIAALVLGGLTEVVFIRRFSASPRLVLTVATIGVAQLLDFVTLALPKLFNYNTTPQPPQPFHFTYKWFPVVFSGGHLLILLVVPVATVGLFVFLQRTRFGIGVRAAAESSDRAAMLGVPVKRLNTLVWILASGLSGLAVLLRLPIQGVSIGGLPGTTVLLGALAPAVIGRMESLPRTLVAALALGVIEQAVFFHTGSTVVVEAILLVVILVALLANRPRGVDRAADRDASSWAAIGQVRPLPRVMRRLPEIRVTAGVGAIAIVVALIVVPLHWTPSRVSLFGAGLVFAMLVCSLVVLTGWTGQISLGQLAFAAIGGCVAGKMAQGGQEFFVTLAAAAVAGTAISVAIGIPALRIKGPFLAVTTLAFAQATGSYIINKQYFPWLVPDGTKPIPRPVLFDKFDLSSEYVMYYVVLIALAITAAVVWRMRTSRTGRTLLAVRDNAQAAQSFGISPIGAQLTAFAVAGCIAGLAGALLVYQQQLVPNSVLQPQSSIDLFVVAVVGGLASLPGAFLGAAYLTFVNYSSFTHQQVSRLFASSLGILAVMLFLRGGLGGAAYALRDRWLRILARSRGLHVPSLLEDSLVLAEDVFLPEGVPDEIKRGEDTMLVVEGLEVSYGKAQVLFGVDFHIDRGEIVALLGTNGAGKSTVLSTVAGLVRPQRGRVLFNGEDITGITPQAALAAGIVLIPGGKAVFPTLTVAEHFRVAAWVHEKTDPDHVAAATEQALDTFPVLRERWDQRAGNLSGGEQQMLGLAQALIAKPSLLMIDELSLGLAPLIVSRLLDIVRAIHASGTTVVLVEQSVNVAASLADRAVFLEKGTVRFSGRISDLLERGDILRAVFLGAESRNGRASAHATRPFVAVCDACGHEHQVALRVDDLAVHFGGIRAVDGVSFEVRSGQVLGLIGPNGAGKTTILDLISGFLTPDEGRVILGGEEVTGLAPHARANLGLGRSFQDARLFSTLTVRETIATAFERHVPVRDSFAAFVLSPAIKASEQELDGWVSDLIDLMGLDAFSDKFVGELSTGTRRIVDLACVLAHKPDVILLDEPSSGIAQKEAEALGPLLLDVRDRTGAGIVVIEHDIALISSISDELIALEAGAQIARGLPEDVLANPSVVAGYLGGSEVVINRSAKTRRRRRKVSI